MTSLSPRKSVLRNITAPSAPASRNREREPTGGARGQPRPTNASSHVPQPPTRARHRRQCDASQEGAAENPSTRFEEEAILSRHMNGIQDTAGTSTCLPMLAVP